MRAKHLLQMVAPQFVERCTRKIEFRTVIRKDVLQTKEAAKEFPKHVLAVKRPALEMILDERSRRGRWNQEMVRWGWLNPFNRGGGKQFGHGTVRGWTEYFLNHGRRVCQVLVHPLVQSALHLFRIDWNRTACPLSSRSADDYPAAFIMQKK